MHYYISRNYPNNAGKYIWVMNWNAGFNAELRAPYTVVSPRTQAPRSIIDLTQFGLKCRYILLEWGCGMEIIVSRVKHFWGRFQRSVANNFHYLPLLFGKGNKQCVKPRPTGQAAQPKIFNRNRKTAEKYVASQKFSHWDLGVDKSAREAMKRTYTEHGK